MLQTDSVNSLIPSLDCQNLLLLWIIVMKNIFQAIVLMFTNFFVNGRRNVIKKIEVHCIRHQCSDMILCWSRFAATVLPPGE